MKCACLKSFSVLLSVASLERNSLGMAAFTPQPRPSLPLPFTPVHSSQTLACTSWLEASQLTGIVLISRTWDLGLICLLCSTRYVFLTSSLDGRAWQWALVLVPFSCACLPRVMRRSPSSAPLHSRHRFLAAHDVSIASTVSGGKHLGLGVRTSGLAFCLSRHCLYDWPWTGL